MGDVGEAGLSYLERPAAVATIFGSFFLIFLPLLALSVIPNFVEALPYLVLLEAVGLGVTHFFITLALYLRSDNLRHFASSRANRLIYFAAPLSILLFFALTAATGLRERAPVFSLYFFGAIRFFDFFHVGRQSFGILQIYKRPVSSALPDWSRRGENAFFVGMAVLQWETFALGGQFRSELLYARLPAIALGGLFVAICASYLQLPREQGLAPGRRRALGYFAMQATCAASAVYDTRLYVIALTMHYVEYHVMMGRRCFAPPPRRPGRVDRAFRPLRRNPVLFYALLLGLVVAFELRNHAPTELPRSTLFFVHIFDGIFFVHYLVEAYLWRFREPYYRDGLGPLFFGRPGARPAGEARATSRRAAWMTGAALALGLGALGAAGALAPAAAALQANVVDPMHAENHVRWGHRLLERGDLQAARAHAEEALRRDPRSGEALRLRADLQAREAP
jgi:hypothetical protein